MPPKKRIVPVIETAHDQKQIILQRQLLVAKEISKGTPIEAIAEKLGIAVTEVEAIAEQVSKHFQDKVENKVKEIKAKDFAATEIALGMVMEGVLEKDPDALRALVPLLKRRADMLGYDATKKVDMSSNGSAVPIAIFGMNLDEI